MTLSSDTEIWLLPGWQNSGPTHWQSCWEREHGDVRLEQHDWERPLRGDWIMRLEETLLASDSPVMLVAHSLGCHLVAAWAAQSQITHKIKGALLVAPPDSTREDFPAVLHSWRQPVLEKLPFAAHVMASSNDPYCALNIAEQMAKAWGAGFECVGPLGHINSESGLHEFEMGRSALQNLEQTSNNS
jgi:predicted alpha/beta hydrolase family esterase